jgi:hypothetical protein
LGFIILVDTQELIMKAAAQSALLIAILSGSAAANTDPTQLDPTAANIRHAGHIYYNIATGEKITTLIESGDTQAAVDGTAGSEIWVADTSIQCADQGYSTQYFLDLHADDFCSSLFCDGEWILYDWGDIPMNTVVDCVQVHWVTDHEDTDTNSDGIADGVAGLAGTWSYIDAMNGRPNQMVCLALPIISFNLYSLPGEFPTDSTEVAMWTADIDLGADFEHSMTFEIGDTDSDLQGADFHNPRLDLIDLDSNSIPDIDSNQDGLADWGWSVHFVRPGLADVDNADGDNDWSTGIDGQLESESYIGVNIASPTPGHAEYDPVEEQWIWVSDGPTAGKTHDVYTVGFSENPDGSGLISLHGPFYFGGLDCSPSQSASYTPAAHFQTILYGPSTGCVRCLADMPSELIPGECPSGDGVLNFLDISYFLSFYAEGNLFVDFAGNSNGSPDGQLNFLDVSAFLSAFAQGCP